MIVIKNESDIKDLNFGDSYTIEPNGYNPETLPDLPIEEQIKLFDKIKSLQDKIEKRFENNPNK